MNPADEPVVTAIRVRRQVDAVGLAIMPRDPRRKAPQTERLGVAEPPVVERRPRGLDHRPRRRRAGLADLHMDDLVAGCSPGRSRRA